ncbi:MAG TPA: hypothetical protein VJ841_04025 [Candidatus Saccharimonadales bacterium]|nr:hypothetical protein [Candidatus Saccharimonadales bacterium]
MSSKRRGLVPLVEAAADGIVDAIADGARLFGRYFDLKSVPDQPTPEHVLVEKSNGCKVWIHPDDL